MGNDINKKYKVYKKVKRVVNCFANEELEKFEEKIFNYKYDKISRAEIEFERILKELKKDPKLYAEYLDDIINIYKNIEVYKINKYIIDDIYNNILLIQLENDMKVRLYSNFYKFYENLKDELIFKGVKKNDKKRWINKESYNWFTR